MYTIAPVIVYGIIFMVLVGIEELTDTAIIGEVYARSLLFVIVGGIAVTIIATLVFAVVVLIIKAIE